MYFREAVLIDCDLPVIRLTQSFLSHEELHQTWIPEIMESAIVKEALLFILQGSTNGVCC